MDEVQKYDNDLMGRKTLSVYHAIFQALCASWISNDDHTVTGSFCWYQVFDDERASTSTRMALRFTRTIKTTIVDE